MKMTNFDLIIRFLINANLTLFALVRLKLNR